MKQISSMDLYFLTKELELIENSRIESFYYEDEIFYVRLYIRGKGHKYLTYKLGNYVYLSSNKDDSSHPSSFVSYLRKYLKNGVIEAVEQIESERILKLKISKKVDEEKFEKYYLFLELFAPGNIILTNNDLSIINMLKRKKFKDRKIVIKEKYELPPQKETSVFNINENKLKDELEKSDLVIVKFLAIKLGTGGKFSEEICHISKIDKNKKANEIDSKELKKILISINKIINMEIKSQLILDEQGNNVDFTPFNFNSIENDKKEVESFNEAIEIYFTGFKNEVDLREKEFIIQLKKLQNILKKQEIQKEKIFEGYEKNNNIGNKIYENYSIIEEILNSINSAAKKKGWENVLLTIKGSEKLSKLIKKLDYKNNKIILNLE